MLLLFLLLMVFDCIGEQTAGERREITRMNHWKKSTSIVLDVLFFVPALLEINPLSSHFTSSRRFDRFFQGIDDKLDNDYYSCSFDPS